MPIQKMLKVFKISYEYRKSLAGQDFWEEFPRYQDISFLVNIYIFRLMETFLMQK